MTGQPYVSVTLNSRPPPPLADGAHLLVSLVLLLRQMDNETAVADDLDGGDENLSPTASMERRG